MTQFYDPFLFNINVTHFLIFNKILTYNKEYFKNIFINNVSRTSHYTSLNFHERFEIIDGFLI